MRLDDNDLSFSATDLAGFSGCAQRTLLDRLRVLGKAHFDIYPDPRLELLRKRGMEHERRYLEQLGTGGKRVVTFDSLPKEERNRGGYTRRTEETLAAMRSGADVIYQGTLYDGQWLGFVDFLLRVERPSNFGPWSYEVADAKLAREPKSAALLQTCVYSELLERAQGAAPEHVHLYLGGPSPHQVSFRLAHYGAYYRALKGRFLTHVESATEDPPIAPDPVDLCQYCDWRTRCDEEREDVDHLSLVAGIASDHRRALLGAGVTTMATLAALPLDPPPLGLRKTGFQRIREQARAQVEGRTRRAPYHEILPLSVPESGRALGLAGLPEPSPHDLFFDIEGADYAYDVGLEYLFGLSDTTDGYKAAWALTPDEEKSVLDRFLAAAAAQVEAHPGAHIYHFGHYEATALKRLVGRYGIRTKELDDLLRQEVLVDLHRIVKQGVLASVDSYSIKALERFYRFERSMPLTKANPARARLEFALATGLLDEEGRDDRQVVERYNLDDCVSTRALRDWLEGLRAELTEREGRAIPRPALTPPPEEKSDETERERQIGELKDRLLAGVSEDVDARPPDHQIRWLAAHLLEWHRREDKSAWWDYFRLRELSDEEMVEETKPLAGLEYIGIDGPEKQSHLYRFSFPPQDHRLSEGNDAFDPHQDGEKLVRREVWAIDELEGTLVLKVSKKASFNPSALRALLPDEVVQTKSQRAQLFKTAQLVLEGEAVLGSWSPASLALLRCTHPTFAGGVGLSEVSADAPLLERAKEAALRLQDGVLPVQGPPGTGKTFSGARMIRALIRSGRRVGVTGPSHKVITNLLDAVADADKDKDDHPTDIVGLQAIKGSGCIDPRFTPLTSAGDVATAMSARTEGGDAPFNFIAGTAWLWAREEMKGSVDVLFIDEAGQFSLANALAVAPAAPKLVLLGDPQQLAQPQKGIHPPGTEVSVLEHLAGEDGILSAEQGLFLGETWRMRPEITAFTSELFYEGKLESRGDLASQRLVLPGGEEVHGLFLVEVDHVDNSRESAEEADAVVRVFRRLLTGGTTFTDRKGVERALQLKDLLVVAPYNAQVSRIVDALADAGFPNARVGTVDKFQGQEAPVAIYSLATSSALDAPRGMDFLYALDRLNVATSRARCATVVVASPRIFTAECRRPEQMRMVNAFARYLEMGKAMR